MRRTLICIAAILVLFLVYTQNAYAQTTSFDMNEQLDSLGKEELMRQVPDDAKELMEEANIYTLSVKEMLELSPQKFFSVLWRRFTGQIGAPVRTLGIMAAVLIFCALMQGMKSASGENELSKVFTIVSVLCILTSVMKPIIDCVVETSGAVKDAATFMLTFVPVFSASLVASGQPATGAGYNLFLFSSCQVISQIVAQTLIPLMGIYLALCIVGSIAPELKISSAASSVKTIVSWSLGFLVTLFVGLLSVQTMVSSGADSLTAKTAKFMIGSFVPVVGGALSDSMAAAQGCLKLIKTTVGGYGILVSALTFLPILIKTVTWYAVTGIAGMTSDILGIDRVSSVMKSCSSVLGLLVAVILSFALFIIVSTAVVMSVGLGGG